MHLSFHNFSSIPPLADTQSASKLDNAAYFLSTRKGEISAAVCLSVLPPLVFATAAQKFLVKGLSSGAVKG